jgi:arylformamidase
MTELYRDSAKVKGAHDGMDRAAIDLAYNCAAAFSDVAKWREIWHERSLRASLPKGSILEVPYGARPLQKIDVFPIGLAQAATVLFFHGGFWSRHDKGTFRFLLDPIHRAGFNAAFAGYTLAPVRDFGEIVADAAQATQWLASNLSALGLAQKALVLLGWSAGAHLVAMQMDRPGIAAGIAISGIYDLEPMRIGSVNDLLHLDQNAVERYSPSRLKVTCSAPLTVAYGMNDLPAFQEQSINFYEAWARRSLPVSLLALPGHHHHSVFEDLYPPSGQLHLELMKLHQLTDA